MADVRKYVVGDQKFIADEDNRIILRNGKFISQEMYLVPTPEERVTVVPEMTSDFLTPGTRVIVLYMPSEESRNYAREGDPLEMRSQPIVSTGLMPVEQYSAKIAQYCAEQREYDAAMQHSSIALDAAIAKLKQKVQKRCDALVKPTLDDLF